MPVTSPWREVASRRRVASCWKRIASIPVTHTHHYGAHYQLAVALLGSGRRDAAQAAWREFVAMADAIGDHGSLESAPALLRISTR